MNVINIEFSRYLAKQHSYENAARLLYSLQCSLQKDKRAAYQANFIQSHNPPM